MFDDRLESRSPGKLPRPITLERLGYGQLSQNNVIARVSVELGFIEEVGLGIGRMREEMASFGLPEPELRGMASASSLLSQYLPGRGGGWS